MSRKWKISWVDCNNIYETVLEECRINWCNMPCGTLQTFEGITIECIRIIKMERIVEEVK